MSVALAAPRPAQARAQFDAASPRNLQRWESSSQFGRVESRARSFSGTGTAELSTDDSSNFSENVADVSVNNKCATDRGRLARGVQIGVQVEGAETDC